MAIAKSEDRDRDLKDIDKGDKFRRNPLFWFILISLLAHGLGLLLYGKFGRSQPLVQKEKNKPIEFIVVPEESTEEPPPKTQRKAENNSVAEKPVEPEKPETTAKVGGDLSNQNPASPSKAAPVPPPPAKIPPIAPEPELPPPPVKTPPIAPEPPAPPPLKAEKPQPKPIEPPVEKQLPVLSGSDSAAIAEPKPNPVKEPKPITETKPATPNSTTPPPPDDPVATSLPSQLEPTQPSTPAPTTPPPPTNPEAPAGAASLLGGDYQQSLAQGAGDAFFSPEALAYKTVLNPSQLNALKDLDLGPYFAEIRRRVKRNWQPSYAAEDYTTFLTFAIQQDGQITGLRVARTSGSEAVDRESIKAVQNSAPFDPLPANFPLEALEVEFTFNIYIY